MPGMPVMMEFISPLNIVLGAVIIEPGMHFQYTNYLMHPEVRADIGNETGRSVMVVPQSEFGDDEGEA